MEDRLLQRIPDDALCKLNRPGTCRLGSLAADDPRMFVRSVALDANVLHRCVLRNDQASRLAEQSVRPSDVSQVDHALVESDLGETGILQKLHQRTTLPCKRLVRVLHQDEPASVSLDQRKITGQDQPHILCLPLSFKAGSKVTIQVGLKTRVCSAGESNCNKPWSHLVHPLAQLHERDGISQVDGVPDVQWLSANVTTLQASDGEMALT